MKWFLRILLGLVVLGLVGAGSAWALVRSESPAIPLEGETDHRDALDVRAVLEHIGDPRQLTPGSRRTVTLDQRQVDAIVAEASRRFRRASGRAKLLDGAVEVEASAESPWPWLTPYVDVTARVTGTPDAPRVLSARLGSLPVPAAIVQPRAEKLYALLRDMRPWIDAVIDAVDDVAIRDGEVTVAYRWTPELEDELKRTGRQLVLGELRASRLLEYHDAVTALTEEFGRREKLPFVRLVETLFGVAEAHVDAGADPALEVRAASLVGTFYLLRRPLGRLIGEELERPPKRTVILWGRADLPKHFLVSVVLTLWGDRAFADALGLSKEITDSTDEGGSGFSFADLAADRAGTQLAHLAMASPEAAEALVRRLAAPTTDEELLPDPTRLPEGMTNEEFLEVYSHVDSPEYAAMVAAIDARLEASDVRRALP